MFIMVHYQRCELFLNNAGEMIAHINAGEMVPHVVFLNISYWRQRAVNIFLTLQDLFYLKMTFSSVLIIS